MAEWKKVIVSGSAAELAQLNVEPNQQISGSAADTFLSGSFSGSFQGDGSQLTNLPVAPPFPYTGSAIISGSLIVTGSTNLYNSGSTVLSVSGSFGNLLEVSDDVTGDLLTIQSGSIELFTISASGLTTLSGSLTVTQGITASLHGTASWALNTLTASVLPNALSNGSGISSFTYDGSSVATVEVSGAAALSSNTVTKWTGDAFANSTITDDGSLVTFSTGALFQGDITVQGTASFQSTENLLVADRFVLFASGSNTTGDGGIVVQQGTQNVGELYGYDSTATRWGFTGSFNASSTSYAPEAFIAAVIDEDNGQADIAKYQKNGNIRVSGSDIYIYA